MPRLRSGDLRRIVEVQSSSEVKDALGGTTFSRTTDNTRYANIEQLTADEKKDHEQLQGSNTVKITMRYYAGLDISNRIKYGTRIFNILSVDNVWERNHVTTAIAIEEQ